MKRSPFVFCLYLLASLVPLLIVSCGAHRSTNEKEIVEPYAIEGKKDLFEAGNFFFAGQPDEELFGWLAAHEVTLVVNLRTDKEMAEHTEKHFDEEKLVHKLGMEYARIPLGGDDGYPPAALSEFAKLLKKHDEGKVLIHCAAAGRVSHLWMAYLVKYRGLSIDEAIAIGKKITFRFPMEELLGTSFTIREKR